MTFRALCCPAHAWSKGNGIPRSSHPASFDISKAVGDRLERGVLIWHCRPVAVLVARQRPTRQALRKARRPEVDLIEDVLEKQLEHVRRMLAMMRTGGVTMCFGGEDVTAEVVEELCAIEGELAALYQGRRGALLIN